jgi:hypothetical protein
MTLSVKILFCQAFFQSAQHIYGKREGSEAGSGSIPLTVGSRSGRPKKCGTGPGSPTLIGYFIFEEGADSLKDSLSGIRLQ